MNPLVISCAEVIDVTVGANREMLKWDINAFIPSRLYICHASSEPLWSGGGLLTINQPKQPTWFHTAVVSVWPPEGPKSQRKEACCNDCRSALTR